MGFSYQQLLGELMYAYVICCLDISYAVTFMAHFSQHPTESHYRALKNIVCYLHATKSWGLMYWRPAPLDIYPSIPYSLADNDSSLPSFPEVDPNQLTAFHDALHATNLNS